MKTFAPSEDYRIAIDIRWAKRSLTTFGAPKGSNAAARRGLTYERRVGRELDSFLHQGKFFSIEHNPWFSFVDVFGSAACCPDYLIWLDPGRVIACEVKLTWVAVALPKLRDLYIPVVERALGVVATPLLICRALAPGAGRFHSSLGAAIADAESPTVVWPAHRRIPW